MDAGNDAGGETKLREQNQVGVDGELVLAYVSGSNQLDEKKLALAAGGTKCARVDADGCYWLLGRVDDVLNVAGHRLGTMEVESALVDHPAVAEAAVVGRPHEIKGQAVAAFVTLKEGHARTESLVDELKDHVVKKIGAIARPDQILFAADLPKTRSGKIMRRLLRDIAEGRALGDTTTLADPSVVSSLKEQYEDQEG